MKFFHIDKTGLLIIAAVVAFTFIEPIVNPSSPVRIIAAMIENALLPGISLDKKCMDEMRYPGDPHEVFMNKVFPKIEHMNTPEEAIAVLTTEDKMIKWDNDEFVNKVIVKCTKE